LLNEKKRVQGQIDLLEKSKTRLEAAIATADLEVQRLSERIQAIEDASKPKTNVPPDNTQASQPAIP
jgi:hypothetical protein